MKIDEYQAKKFFSSYAIPIPLEIVCKTSKEIKEAAEKNWKKSHYQSTGTGRRTWKSRGSEIG